MDLGVLIVALQGLLVLNLLYGLLFLIAYKGISNFYPCLTREFDGVFLFISSIISFYFCGLSYYAATFFYNKTNWFFARILVLLYSGVLIVLISVFGDLLMEVI